MLYSHAEKQSTRRRMRMEYAISPGRIFRAGQREMASCDVHWAGTCVMTW